MFKGVNHIGVVVRNLDEAIQMYSGSFGFELKGPVKAIKEMGIRDAMVSNGPVTFELIEPVDPASPMAKFLEKNGEGLHHISLEVEDIHLSMDKLNEAGVSLIGKEAVTLDDSMLSYVHPKSAKGVLIEIVQPLKKDDE
ncbi:MAG: VOC family protein [Deltaproteobacteria bacterium]|nr:VOC family protein [Deltaproteobacteria bacterium]